ncbi:MAG: hypothetical protein Q8P41_20850 [Pseudomonadota bacterium]|nr:hypothetical protein [Pseudomonadota bacterium]
MLALPLLALLGCFGSSSSPHCETVEREVADDDDLGDLPFTVADLVADVIGARTVPASDMNSAPIAAELAVERGEGAASFSDATETIERTARIGWGDNMMALDLMCEDSVEVPVEYSLTTDDGKVALDREATASGGFAFGDIGAGANVRIDDTVDLADATLPNPPDSATGVQVQISFLGPDLDGFSIAWRGGNRNGDTVVVHPPDEPAR